MTATMKECVKAPSIQGKPGEYIIIPDILAVDEQGNGWCFEVKDEGNSSYDMAYLEMSHGYTGPVWFLQRYKAKSYLSFSRAYDCPCVIAVKGWQQWKMGFFTRKRGAEIDYNRSIVAENWRDADGIPILFNVMDKLDDFLDSHSALREKYWR